MSKQRSSNITQNQAKIDLKEFYLIILNNKLPLETGQMAEIQERFNALQNLTFNALNEGDVPNKC